MSPVTNRHLEASIDLARISRTCGLMPGDVSRVVYEIAKLDSMARALLVRMVRERFEAEHVGHGRVVAMRRDAP